MKALYILLDGLNKLQESEIDTIDKKYLYPYTMNHVKLLLFEEGYEGENKERGILKLDLRFPTIVVEKGSKESDFTYKKISHSVSIIYDKGSDFPKEVNSTRIIETDRIINRDSV